jgi:hypothetical protein
LTAEQVKDIESKYYWFLKDCIFTVFFIVKR